MAHCRAVDPDCRSSRKNCCRSRRLGEGQSAAVPWTGSAAHRGKGQEGRRWASLLEDRLKLHIVGAAYVVTDDILSAV